MTKAMGDGYSTAGTMGGGMGAMKQNRHLAGDLYQWEDGNDRSAGDGLSSRSRADLQVAGMAIPYPGERLCGDAWAYHQTPERTVILLVDGLGHGLAAAEAAEEAVAMFQQAGGPPPGEILSYVHEGLKKTRGAVAAVAEIRPQAEDTDLRWRGQHLCVRGEPAEFAKPGFAQWHAGAGHARIQEFKAGLAGRRHPDHALRWAADTLGPVVLFWIAGAPSGRDRRGTVARLPPPARRCQRGGGESC